MSKTLINIITVILMLSSFTFAQALSSSSNVDNNTNNIKNPDNTNNTDVITSSNNLNDKPDYNKNRENLKDSPDQLNRAKIPNSTDKQVTITSSPIVAQEQPDSKDLQPRGLQGPDTTKPILPNSSMEDDKKDINNDLKNADKLGALDKSNPNNNSSTIINNSDNANSANLNNKDLANPNNNSAQYNNKYDQDKLLANNRILANPPLDKNSTNFPNSQRVNNTNNMPGRNNSVNSSINNSTNRGVNSTSNTISLNDVNSANSDNSNNQSDQEKLFFKNRPVIINAPDNKSDSLTNNSDTSSNNNNINNNDNSDNTIIDSTNKSSGTDQNINNKNNKKIIGSSAAVSEDTTSKPIATENSKSLYKQQPTPLEKSDEEPEVNKPPAKRDFSAQCFYEILPRAIFHNNSQAQRINQSYLVEPLSLADYTKLLFINIKKDNISVLNGLLNIIGTTEIKNSMGETPLIYAAKENKINSVRFLLTKKANIQAQNRNGQTALELANQLGNRAIVKVLA